MSDPTVENEISLPLRVVNQPTPEVSAGGDCGACVLSGLLDMAIEDVYKKLHPKGEPHPFSHRDMASALQTAKWELGFLDRYITRTPMWPVWDSLRAWGDASWSQSMEWREWLTMAFDAGYYAIAEVRSTPEPMRFDTDHWVMYAGTRTQWDGPPESRRSGQFQLLVSDSGRTKPHEKWYPLSEHLKERGGFAVMLARPKR